MGRKGQYLPVITVLATVLILLVLQGVSTLRNFHRERMRMGEFLFQNGLIVLGSLETSFRSGMMEMLTKPANLQWLMSQISTLTDIRFVSIIEEDGFIIAHSDEKLVGTSYPQIEKLRELVGQKGPNSWFDTDRILVVVKSFETGSPSILFGQDEHAALHAAVYPMMGEKRSALKAILSGRTYAVVGLDTRIFQEARQKDFHHAVMMGLILLVLGSASLYFIFVVQNYYIINRTLDSMTTYTTHVVENMPDGVFSIDNSGEIGTMNNRALEMFHLENVSDKRGELKRRVSSFVKPLLNALKHKGRILGREIEYVSDEGDPIPLSVSAARLISQDGQDLGAVFILRDLREIKEFEEKVKRSERLASLGSLAAGMAHEIRNPLSSIKGFAQFFLNKTSSGSTEHKYSQVMIKEVDRLNRVISNLLDFARPKEPVKEKTSIVELIHHAVELIQDDARSKGIQIIKEIEEGLPPIELDRDQITQVLINIELNALDAMEEGGSLLIRCFRETVENCIALEIEDTGHGISREERSKIFDPFYTTKKRGTGLGLAIAHRIVESHNGTLSVRSVEGSRTVFCIELPISWERER